ncbi:hypothetical protein BJX70DRAFT_400307 [Aspergillus crustosus]
MKLMHAVLLTLAYTTPILTLPLPEPNNSITPRNPATSIKDLARLLLPDGPQFACLDQILEPESHWAVTATNPTTGAYGLFQALPGDKMAAAGPDWRTNPETQIRWGLGYIRGRYRDSCAALEFRRGHGWY